MPVKVKKENKVIKKKPVRKPAEKLTQAQIQRQVVNVRIGDLKKQVRRRVVRKTERPIIQQSVQPVQYLYQSTGSQPIPQFQNFGVAQQARANILAAEPLPIERPVKAEEPLRLGSGADVRSNILGGSNNQPQYFPEEYIRKQRELRLRMMEEQRSLFDSFPNAEIIDNDNPSREGIEEEVNIEPLQSYFGGAVSDAVSGPGAVKKAISSIEDNIKQTEAARTARRDQQIDEGRGSDVPLELLIQRRYNNQGQPPRRIPTINQRQRLFQNGTPYKGDENGVEAKSKKKK